MHSSYALLTSLRPKNGSLARSGFLQRRVPLLLDARARLFHVKAKAGDVFTLADGTSDQLLELRPNRPHLFYIIRISSLIEFVDFKVLDYACALFRKSLVIVPFLIFFSPRNNFHCLFRFHREYLTI